MLRRCECQRKQGKLAKLFSFIIRFLIGEKGWSTSLFIYTLCRNVLVLMIDAEERRRKKRGRLITNTTIECE